MAEDTNAPDAIRFEKEEHDVTCCLEHVFCGNTKLILGAEEAELYSNCCVGICNTKKRGPYGELGTVDSANICCFVGFSAASLMQEGHTQCTGLGCETEKVGNIVTELKKRQAYRGDRAKTRMAETTLYSMAELNTKMDLIIKHLEISLPAEGDEISLPAEGDEISLPAEGDEISLPAEGDEISLPAKGDEISLPAEGDAPVSTGLEISVLAEGNAIATTPYVSSSARDRIASEFLATCLASGQIGSKLAPPMRDAIDAPSKGDAINAVETMERS